MEPLASNLHLSLHVATLQPITLWYTQDAQLWNFTADVFDYLVGDEALEVCDVEGEAAHEVTQMLWPDHCIQVSHLNLEGWERVTLG